jgi:hypothetical protein
MFPCSAILQGQCISSTAVIVNELSAGVPVLFMGNGTAGRAVPDRFVIITVKLAGSGSHTAILKSPEGFETGQSVFVSQEVTADWVRYNGMADFIREDKPQTWIAVRLLHFPRHIVLFTSLLSSFIDCARSKRMPSSAAIPGDQEMGKRTTFTVLLADWLGQKSMSPYLVGYSSPIMPQEPGLNHFCIPRGSSCSGLSLDANSPCAAAAMSVPP